MVKRDYIENGGNLPATRVARKDELWINGAAQPAERAGIPACRYSFIPLKR